MKLNINNIIAVLLVIGALIVFSHNRGQAIAFLSTAKRLGPGNSLQDMTCGLLTIGICGAVLVAVVRILVRGRRD